MGLLDSLLSGGGGGGLLDFLNNPQMLQSVQSGGFQPASTTFADRFGAAPSAPQSFQPSGRQFDQTAFDPQAYTGNSAQPISVGGYQMPRIGSAEQFTAPSQSAAMLPPNAQPTQGQLPPQAPQQPQQMPPAFGQQPSEGIGGNVLTGLQSFLNGGGLISSVRGAMNGQRADPAGMAQQNLSTQFNAIRRALISNGETPQAAASKAMVAAMNPEAAKTILPELFTAKEKYQKIGADGLGNEQYGFVNDRNLTVNGQPLGADGSAAGAATSSAGGFLAPGVKTIDSSLTGGDYLKQISPEVQAAVQNYVDGKSMPTGNPRKGFTQTVKMIAQKYGADTNQPVDDATYSARRTMRNQLSSSAPSSLGGQINIGNTAAGHLADLTQKALDLGNVDTGLAPLTHAVNNVRGLGTEQAAKMEALKGAAQHYGQEITKFYAGSPGGVAERDRFIESVNGARSPKELAAILATEGELMRSRLDALGGQIKGVLGDEGLKQYPVLRPDGQKALRDVEQNVSKLKGGQTSASGGVQEGATATNPQTGQKLTYRGGKWQ